MSLFRQLLITNSQKKKRPYYCEVEYLQTSGTQYIDTGYPVHFNEDTITLIAELTEPKEYQTVYGVFESFDGTVQFFAVRQLSTQEKWQSVGIQLTFPAYELNKKFRLQLSKVDETYFQYLGETVYTGRVNDNKDTSFTGYIFATNNRGNVAYHAIGKIYAFQHKRNGVLIRDMIPVLDWDMRPALYDKVSGELLYNAGKGEFSYGREIHYVEYLESTGTQYIDTGVYFNDTTHTYEWDIDAQAVNSGHTSGYNWFTGYNQNGVNSCGTYSDNVTYTFYPAGKYYQDGALVSTPSGGDKYAPVKNKISLTNKICDYSLVLFARMVSSSNTIDAGGTKRIFTAKYYDNSVLVRDYIPAVDENGVGFMFDKVTHTIYDNAGEGVFKYPLVELEYLKCTGTQYIDTGITATTSSTVDVAFGLSSIEQSGSNNGAIFGGRTAQTNNSFTLFYIASSAKQFFRFDYQGQVAIAYNNEITFDTTSKYNFTYDGSVAEMKNLTTDESMKRRLNPPASTNTTNIHLFAVDTNGTVSTYLKGRIYSYRYSDDINSIDLIPVFKDGQVGMWDKVNNTLYTNAGTGSFVTGRIIEKESEVNNAT